MAQNRLKIGFIGCGRAAQTVHLPYFATSDLCEVTTLVDRRRQLASKVAAQYGIPKVSDDYHVLCDDPEIQAVAMILREPLHAPVAIDLMQAGKHVFTEKPISDSYAGAQKMAEIARQTKRLLMVGYMRRYDPGIQRAKELLAELASSDVAGRITQVQIGNHGGGTSAFAFGAREPLTSDEEKPAAPLIYDDGFPPEINRLSLNTNFLDTHLTDMLIYLLGSPRRVEYAHSQTDPPNRLFVYDHGDFKTIHTGASYGRSPRDERLAVYFEHARLTVRPSENFLRDAHAQVELITTAGLTPTVQRPIIAGTWCFKAQAEDFLTCVSTGKRPCCTGEDALKNAHLLHATFRKLAGFD